MPDYDTGHKPISETVTVTFLANVEVDPEEFDLRVQKPEKIRAELFGAATGRCSLQQLAATSDEALERYRRKIKEARDS